MNCVKCNAGDECQHNLGGKEHYPHGNYRYYVCSGCGYRYRTLERHDRPVEPKPGYRKQWVVVEN